MARLEAYQFRTAQIRERLTNQSEALWLALGSYRDPDIDKFVRITVPRVSAAQLATARVTAAYFKSPMVSRDLVTGARKVDPQVEYRRPANSLYTALSQGKDLATGVKAGTDRLMDLLTTDVQLAKTTQADASLRYHGYKYYKRTLTGAENCALCSIASTQRYHVGDLMPIHPGCDCGVDEVAANFDPGQILDADLLEDTHMRVEEFTGVHDRGGRNPDYRQLLITHEHGEWGPTLAWRGDKFTGPSDVPAVLAD